MKYTAIGNLYAHALKVAMFCGFLTSRQKMSLQNGIACTAAHCIGSSYLKHYIDHVEVIGEPVNFTSDMKYQFPVRTRAENRILYSNRACLQIIYGIEVYACVLTGIGGHQGPSAMP